MQTNETMRTKEASSPFCEVAPVELEMVEGGHLGDGHLVYDPYGNTPPEDPMLKYMRGRIFQRR